MIAEVKLSSAYDRHESRHFCCVKIDNLMIDEAAFLFMRHSLIDYNKPNMDNHCQ